MARPTRCRRICAEPAYDLSLIHIFPDYTPEEKKVIFSKFALPKVLKRMGLEQDECIIEGEALDAVIERYADTSGIRDLEQAAEHLAANALYRIEVDHVKQVVFTSEKVKELLE